MLTKRQSDVLRMIVQTYTSTGTPVGSNYLKDAGIKASSATIRNDMSALEEMGLLRKNHSSSGRIPSMLGYRYYVDHLLQPADVPLAEKNYISSTLDHDFHEINDIIENSAKILADLTKYTAFSLGPEMNNRRLTGFRIIALNDHQIIAVVVTDKGNVESRVYMIPEGVTSEDLKKMVQLINERLVGLDLLTVYHKLRTEIPLILNRYFQQPNGMAKLFDTFFGDVFDNRSIYVSGKVNLLDFHFNQIPQDLNQFHSVYSFMENPQALIDLFDDSEGVPAVDIKIGSEIGNKLLQDMSMITAAYHIKGHGQGLIALLGPTNMPYSKIYGLLNVFREELGQKLSDYYQAL